MDSYIKYIKGALVITPQDIKKKKSVLKRIIGFYNTSKDTLIGPLQYTKEIYSK